MIRSWWVLPAVAMSVGLVAGCGSEPPAGGVPPGAETAPPTEPPMSGPVAGVEAICGVQGLYWQGRWWADELPLQTVRDESSTRLLSGTMTTVGNDHARLDSPDLVAPQMLRGTPNTNPAAPPFQACAPTVP